MLFRCTGGEFVQLEGLCDGFNNCTSGEDERSLLCESKLYATNLLVRLVNTDY